MFKAIKEFFLGKPAEPVKEEEIIQAEAPYKVETPAAKVEAVNAIPVAKVETAKPAVAKASAKAKTAPAKAKAPAKKPAATKPAPKRRAKK